MTGKELEDNILPKEHQVGRCFSSTKEESPQERHAHGGDSQKEDEKSTLDMDHCHTESAKRNMACIQNESTIEHIPHCDISSNRVLRSMTTIEHQLKNETEEKTKANLKGTGLSDEEDAVEIRSTTTSASYFSDKEGEMQGVSQVAKASSGMRNSISIRAHDIGVNDVILGRAGSITVVNEGNNKLRDLVNQHKQNYQESLSKLDKTRLSRTIVNEVRQRGGHFLKLDHTSGVYREATDNAAREKVSHMLRSKQEDTSNGPRRRQRRKKKSPKKAIEPKLDQTSLNSLFQKQQQLFSEMTSDGGSMEASNAQPRHADKQDEFVPNTEESKSDGERFDSFRNDDH